MRDSLSFYESQPPHAPISVFSIPTELGSDARGLHEAPRFLYDAGLSQMLAHVGAEVAQEKSIPSPSPRGIERDGVKDFDDITALAHEIAAQVSAALSANQLPLCLGGDHSIALGTIAGAQMALPSLGLIWVDAHPDAHTPRTSLTGNAHGMGAARALGAGHLAWPAAQPIKAAHAVFIGLKDFDEAEMEFLRGSGAKHFTMHDIARRGLAPVMQAIEDVARKVERMWVSFDMDAIDAQFAPGVAMQNDAGLTRREALFLARHIGKICDVAGIDIVEMLPANDSGRKTATLALEILALLLGGQWGGYERYMLGAQRMKNPDASVGIQ